jgi:hypothetical protein
MCARSFCWHPSPDWLSRHLAVLLFCCRDDERYTVTRASRAEVKLGEQVYWATTESSSAGSGAAA